MSDDTATRELRLTDDQRAMLRAPDSRMDAYYYSFERTGNEAIDAILSAVAWAGKGWHNTSEWVGDPEEFDYGPFRGMDPERVIQAAANEAALASRPAPAETKTIRQFHGDDVWRDDEGLIWVRLSESIEAVEFARSVPAPVGEVEREELKAAIARYDRAKAESFHPAGSFDERSAAHAVVEIARRLEVSAGPWLPVPDPDNEGGLNDE